jgi:hypothetical protein
MLPPDASLSFQEYFITKSYFVSSGVFPPWPIAARIQLRLRKAEVGGTYSRSVKQRVRGDLFQDNSRKMA